MPDGGITVLERRGRLHYWGRQVKYSSLHTTYPLLNTPSLDRLGFARVNIIAECAELDGHHPAPHAVLQGCVQQPVAMRRAR